MKISLERDLEIQFENSNDYLRLSKIVPEFHRQLCQDIITEENIKKFLYDRSRVKLIVYSNGDSIKLRLVD